MFHKILINCLMLDFAVYSASLFAQISEGGVPPSFQYQLSLRSAPSVMQVPIDFYIEDLRETDQWQARQGVPMPVAKLIPVDYSMDNSGFFSLLPGGENIWRLHLKAKDAIAIMLYYKDFYIPEGGSLFIYSADKSKLLGAYTHRTHPKGGRFASEFVGGDELILEYVASETSVEQPRINISEIGYGYNTSALREFCQITTRAASGSCNVNINCEEGIAWQNEKKGVCYTVQRIATRSYICTASLMNNTAEDFQPLILTAEHCSSNGTSYASKEDMTQWLFYFHREHEGCSNSSLTNVSKTMVGCSLLVRTGMAGGSDGLLLLLEETIPEYYDVFYNGWDRSGDVATSGVCIHHPNGDYQKISTYDDPLRSTTFSASEFTGEAHAHWNVAFKATPNGHGVTEAGSSGSPLYNENKLVVGTLTGGSSSCNNLRGQNLYGKFSYHWDRYKADSSKRMDLWLDPLNTEVTSFPGRFRKELKPSPLNLRVVNLGPSVSLTWDAPKSYETPIQYNVYRNNLKIDETTALNYIDRTPIEGTIIYSISAVYDNDEESGFTSAPLLLQKYKAPFGLKAERHGYDNERAELSWDAPVYEQIIFWGTLYPYRIIGFGSQQPFYFGQMWTAEEIKPLHNTTIKAIQFFPIERNVYEIFISQGEQSYRQPIETASLASREMNTISLNTPFVINGSLSLIVSIYTSQVKTNYPAVCDDGPAVNGKGNMCSINGIEWFRLNEDEKPGDFDYNFIVTAIVSSEKTNTTSHSSNNKVVKGFTTLSQNGSLLKPRKDVFATNDTQVALRNSVPAPFPVITKYRVYKSGSIFKEVTPPVTYSWDNLIYPGIYYEVTAFYGQSESEKSDKAYITTVDNVLMDASIRITPTVFSDYITLQGHESVTRIEVLSVSGKVCIVVDNPGLQVNTALLAPGLYFFRLFDTNHNQKVIKAAKK